VEDAREASRQPQKVITATLTDVGRRLPDRGPTARSGDFETGYSDSIGPTDGHRLLWPFPVIGADRALISKDRFQALQRVESPSWSLLQQ